MYQKIKKLIGTSVLSCFIDRTFDPLNNQAETKQKKENDDNDDGLC